MSWDRNSFICFSFQGNQCGDPKDTGAVSDCTFPIGTTAHSMHVTCHLQGSVGGKVLSSDSEEKSGSHMQQCRTAGWLYLIFNRLLMDVILRFEWQWSLDSNGMTAMIMAILGSNGRVQEPNCVVGYLSFKRPNFHITMKMPMQMF